LLNNYGVHIVNAPPLHSTSNGQVERFHSTLAELARCLKLERNISDSVEVILLATIEYNKTIHSVINKRPVDALHVPPGEPQGEISAKLKSARDALRTKLNDQRQNRVFKVAEKVQVKRNRRLGNKLTPLDLSTTVLIRGRVVHKDNLK